MAQISLVKTLVLSYMELQRQIDAHTADTPAYQVREWRDEQAAILASLEAKKPSDIKLGGPAEIPEAFSNIYGAGSNSSPDAMRKLGELIESQKEEL
jgi:hypothetical protein